MLSSKCVPLAWRQRKRCSVLIKVPSSRRQKAEGSRKSLMDKCQRLNKKDVSHSEEEGYRLFKSNLLTPNTIVVRG